jgi:hypothetical protein
VEILRASLDAHPLKLVAEKITKSGANIILEAAERIGRRVTVAVSQPDLTPQPHS